MLLSVLLPTRNGGDFIAACIEAVLGQDAELELVVSDNANEDATPEVLAGFRDERLRCVRTDRVLSVTDNWLNALNAARGDYVLMLGDDDLLLPGCVTWLSDAIASHGSPDCLTFNAFTYVYPMAISGLEVSHYAEPHFAFDEAFTSGCELDRETRLEIVRDMFRYRVRIPLNMQTTVFARYMGERLPRPLFHGPFPDHYALNAMLLTSDRWAFEEHKPLVVGVSPKSFGHFVYSSGEDEGLAYLGITTQFEGHLPGNPLLSAMTMWLDLLRRDFADYLDGLVPSRPHYVAGQMWAWLQQLRAGTLSRSTLLRRLARLTPTDWIGLARLVADPTVVRRASARVRSLRAGRAEQVWSGLRPLYGVHSIVEFADWMARTSSLEDDRCG